MPRSYKDIPCHVRIFVLADAVMHNASGLEVWFAGSGAGYIVKKGDLLAT